jgi:multidrug efflux pump subunit AcrA (membrane-fusion protein)
MRILTQLLTGLVFLAVGALILLHFVPGSAGMARSLGIPDYIVTMVAKPAPTALPPEEGNQRRNQGQQLTVVVKAAEQGKINDRLRAIGDGDAIRSVGVTPLVAGQIAEMRVKPGQRVKAGEVIARLDDAVEKVAVQQAKVALQAAEASRRSFRRPSIRMRSLRWNRPGLPCPRPRSRSSAGRSMPRSMALPASSPSTPGTM